MTRLLVLLVLAGVLTAPAAAGTPDPPAGPGREILRLLRAAEEAWNAGDIPGYMAPYRQAADLRFASGGTVTRGWQPTLDRYLARYPDRGAMGRLVFGDLDVQLLGPDHALVFGSWRLVRSADEPHGLFTLVWRRLPEGWRIVHDHTSRGE